MEQRPSQYRSYLLRLWCSSDERAWRAMLEDVASHECRYFADVEELCAFLRMQTASAAEGSRCDTAAGKPGQG